MTVADRRWLELAARCPAAGERQALLAEGLLALGGRAIEERAGWYVTHVEDPGDADAFGRRARTVLAESVGLDDVEVRTAWRPHEEWGETWKRGLAVRHVTDRIVVRPSWLEYEVAPGDVVITLDPGMAFGTAEHATTRGCLRLLDRTVSTGDRVLDVGAGSGILSVAAALLGAGSVTAVEGDPLACEALAENLAANGVGERVRLIETWTDADGLGAYAPADCVVANLETGLLLPLLGGLVAALAPTGTLIVSGVLEDEWPDVARRLEAEGCRVDEHDFDEGWVAARLVRRRA